MLQRAPDGKLRLLDNFCLRVKKKEFAGRYVLELSLSMKTACIVPERGGIAAGETETGIALIWGFLS